jgi:hypothetical protein
VSTRSSCHLARTLVPNNSKRSRFAARLNSGVRRQSSTLLSLCRVRYFWLRIGCAVHDVSGWPALSSFARLVVRRVLCALAYFVFVPCRARGSSQRGVCRQRFVLRTQVTTFAALPGIQSSVIVLLTDGVACCRLTSHSSGRLCRRLIPALAIQGKR